MQDALFPDDPLDEPAPPPKAKRVQPAEPENAATALAERLPPGVYLGTSTWTYPGWAGLVWDRAYPEARLSKEGLQAYACHPLLRAVCIDRSFYRPLTASDFQRYALQVPEGFRFVVKAPSLVADAQLRDERGRGQQANPCFLDPAIAASEFVQPALEGLGPKIGALVFQLSPLSAAHLADMPAQLAKLRALLAALPPLRPTAPDAVYAVEVRDPEWLCDEFVALLKGTGTRYCLGLHPKLPPPQEQLWILRKLWPGDFVCRWNLNRRHGPYGYEDAQARYGDYSQMIDPDPELRALIARIARATAEAGHKAFVTVNNKAEGCAPASVQALAQAIIDKAEQMG